MSGRRSTIHGGIPPCYSVTSRSSRTCNVLDRNNRTCSILGRNDLIRSILGRNSCRSSTARHPAGCHRCGGPDQTCCCNEWNGERVEITAFLSFRPRSGKDNKQGENGAQCYKALHLHLITSGYRQVQRTPNILFVIYDGQAFPNVYRKRSRRVELCQIIPGLLRQSEASCFHVPTVMGKRSSKPMGGGKSLVYCTACKKSWNLISLIEQIMKMTAPSSLVLRRSLRSTKCVGRSHDRPGVQGQPFQEAVLAVDEVALHLITTVIAFPSWRNARQRGGLGGSLLGGALGQSCTHF